MMQKYSKMTATRERVFCALDVSSLIIGMVNIEKNQQLSAPGNVRFYPANCPL